MKKLTFACALIAVFLITAAIAYAVVTFYLPQEGTLEPAPTTEFTVTIDGDPWTSETPLPWGPMTIGSTYYCDVIITNTGTTTIDITITTTGLPAGWDQVWEFNTLHLAPTGVATGTVTLTFQPTATLGTQTWTTEITATETAP